MRLPISEYVNGSLYKGYVLNDMWVNGCDMTDKFRICGVSYFLGRMCNGDSVSLCGNRRVNILEQK